MCATIIVNAYVRGRTDAHTDVQMKNIKLHMPTDIKVRMRILLKKGADSCSLSLFRKFSNKKGPKFSKCVCEGPMYMHFCMYGDMSTFAILANDGTWSMIMVLTDACFYRFLAKLGKVGKVGKSWQSCRISIKTTTGYHQDQPPSPQIGLSPKSGHTPG